MYRGWRKPNSHSFSCLCSMFDFAQLQRPVEAGKAFAETIIYAMSPPLNFGQFLTSFLLLMA